MECYRRAMINEQTFEGRRENLNQANKLSRTFAALIEHSLERVARLYVDHGSERPVSLALIAIGVLLPQSSKDLTHEAEGEFHVIDAADRL